MDKTLKLVERYILYATVFLVPVAFANISPNPYIVVKLLLLVTGVSLALLVWSIRIIVTGKLEYHKGSFDIPVFLIIVSYIVSAVFKSTNKMEAVLLPGTATAVVASGLLYFLINQHDNKKGFITVLLASGALFSFVTILSAFGALGAIPQLPSFVKAAGFTPEGGFLPAALFLAILLILGIGSAIVDKAPTSKVINGVLSIFIVFGFIASLVNIIPGGRFAPRFPDLGTSWKIAVDSISNSPFLGVGPGNYLTAFSRFRPLAYNQSDLWAVRFGTASNFYVTSFTETGLLGISGLVLIIFLLYKRLRSNTLLSQEKKVSLETLYVGSLLFLLLILAVFPATILITFLLFVVLAFTASSHKTTMDLQTKGSEEEGASQVATRLPAFLLTLPVLTVLAYVFYKGATIVRAEYTFNKALSSLSQNDAKATYDNMNRAIVLNPYVDRYRMTSAQVSILLANAVAQKKDLSDSDRQTIAGLIQNAIAQGKAGVALNPLRSTNWELLSQIYRAIIPLAKGSDQFAIQTASQAVALDPFNPNLRIALGGIYFAQKDYDNAIKAFETAVAAKNDYPNAYYNLAFAYREKGDLEKAAVAMSRVVALVDKNSQDYQVAQKALEDIQAKRESDKKEQGKELNPPAENQVPDLDPKLDLPEDAKPPQTPSEEETKVGISPTQTVTVAPQLSPTVTPTQTP